MRAMTKKYILGWLFYITAVVGFIAPFMFLYFKRQDVWVTEAEGMNIAMAVIIGIVYMLLVFKGALKKVAPLLSMLISTLIIACVTLFLDSIIQDLSLIMFSVSGGLVLFIVFYKIGARQIELAKVYGNETVRVKARNDSESLGAI